jgi:hypothetical protein
MLKLFFDRPVSTGTVLGAYTALLNPWSRRVMIVFFDEWLLLPVMYDHEEQQGK